LQQSRIEAALKVEPENPAMTEPSAAGVELLRGSEAPRSHPRRLRHLWPVGERPTSSWGIWPPSVAGSIDRLAFWCSPRGGGEILADGSVLSFMRRKNGSNIRDEGQSLFYMGKTNLKHKISRSWRRKGEPRELRAEAPAIRGELTIASTARILRLGPSLPRSITSRGR